MAESDRLDPGLLRLVFTLLLGGVMSFVDGTVVNVGMGTLADHFRASLATVGWVATGYLLAVAVAVPVTGWAVDRFGSRRMWLTGLGVFTLGSLASGLAPNIAALIGFRVVQGFGGGMLDPIMLTVLARAAGPHRAGRVMGLMGMVIPIGPVAGPILGGLILQNLSWRWMFLVNLPIGAVAFALTLRVLPADPPGPDRAANRLDTRGLSLLAPGFAALVFALSGMADHRSVGTTATAAALGAVLLAAYGVHALRARTPLIDLRLFTSRQFSACVAVMGFTGAGLFAGVFVIPLYYQQVHGHGVLAAGLLSAPLGIGSLVAMPTAGRLSDRVGARRLVPLGGLALATSAVVFAFAGADTEQFVLSLCVLLIGLGLGFVGAPTMGALYRTLPAEAVPQGTAALYIVNQFGASLGITIAALIIQTGTAGGGASTDGFHGAFWWMVGVAAAVFCTGWLLPGRPPAAATAQASAQDLSAPAR